MMTLEEAAEEILKGPFTTCTHCRGDGTVLLPMYVHDSVTGIVCKSCKGHGKWRRGDYVAACVLLNKEPVEQLSGFYPQNHNARLSLNAMPFDRAVREFGIDHTLDAFEYAVAHLRKVQEAKGKR